MKEGVKMSFVTGASSEFGLEIVRFLCKKNLMIYVTRRRKF